MVTNSTHPRGINAPTADWNTLHAALSVSPRSIVLDASEGEGRSLASIVAGIQQGGIWVSYGGYPFYYTPSDPGGFGYNFTRFCHLAGISDPGIPGNEFCLGNGRYLMTHTTTLPSPWIANGGPYHLGNGQYGWNMIGVPIGAGWWFYASYESGPHVPYVGPKTYSQWILGVTTPSSAAAGTPSSTAATASRARDWRKWALIGSGVVVIGGVAVVLVRAAKHPPRVSTPPKGRQGASSPIAKMRR